MSTEIGIAKNKAKNLANAIRKAESQLTKLEANGTKFEKDQKKLANLEHKLMRLGSRNNLPNGPGPLRP